MLDSKADFEARAKEVGALDAELQNLQRLGYN